MVLPCVIIQGFCVERTPERIRALGISAVAAIVVLMISVGISGYLFKRDLIAAFGPAFSNPVFLVYL